MQLDFNRKQTVAEKLISLHDLKGKNIYVVVQCGRYRVIHCGQLVDFNQSGTILALNCPTEKNRNEYGETDFIQHERKRNQWGELIKSTDRFQYIPLSLIQTVIDYNAKKSV